MRKVVQVPFAIFTLLLLNIHLRAQNNSATDPWAQFQFLVGDWSGVGSGTPAEAVSGTTSFSFDLEKKILVRRNRAEFAPKQPEGPNVVHEDLMIIYPQTGESGFRAVYFDNEGHVIHYNISFPMKQPSIVLESEGAGSVPRFRLTYESGSDGIMQTEFSIAPPGREFKAYMTGKLERKK